MSNATFLDIAKNLRSPPPKAPTDTQTTAPSPQPAPAQPADAPPAEPLQHPETQAPPPPPPKDAPPHLRDVAGYKKPPPPLPKAKAQAEVHWTRRHLPIDDPYNEQNSGARRAS